MVIPRRRQRDRRSTKRARPKSEFSDKLLELRRVSRVVAGGKRFRFRATMALGDEKGRVGVGIGKGVDVVTAIGKAKADAEKKLVRIYLKDNRTVAHDVEAKYSAAYVLIKPAVRGRGIKAGGAARVVLGLAGIKDVTAKCVGRTTNKLTNALATIEALKKLKTSKARSVPQEVSIAKGGKPGVRNKSELPKIQTQNL